MNYALAKELKDAGFPHNDWGPFYSQEKTGDREIGYNNPPTLSELIEACGEEFGAVRLVRGKWSAETKQLSKSQTKIHICSSVDISVNDCSTPEEAVARLWLALNKPN